MPTGQWSIRMSFTPSGPQNGIAGGTGDIGIAGEILPLVLVPKAKRNRRAGNQSGSIHGRCPVGSDFDVIAETIWYKLMVVGVPLVVMMF